MLQLAVCQKRQLQTMLMLASIDRLEEAEELVMIRQPGVDGARVVVLHLAASCQHC